jgi:exodeoxyribonuclease V alpha subunit
MDPKTQNSLRGRLLVSYLAGNRAFKGIGVARASALWGQFGGQLYDILERGDAQTLSLILGESIASELITAWSEKQAEGKVIEWLDEHGFNARLAHKVIKIWGAEAVIKLGDNPYRMLAFAPWPTVDATAHSLGISFNDDRRLVAAVEWVCYVRVDARHTVTGNELLIRELRKILKCGPALASRAISLAKDECAIIEAPDGWQPLGPAVMERYIAERLRTLMNGKAQGQGNLFKRCPPGGELDLLIGDFESHQRLGLADEQRRAVMASFNHSLLVLTGGAGVGKTTTLKAIHEVSERIGRRVIQMALSGRAARQLRETTGREAVTIAAFLNLARNGKLSGADDSTLIIIDESSMLDLPLTYRILRSVSPRCGLMLVGDPYQLPPIGFGLVFHMLAASNTIPRVELTRVHRQAASTGIPDVAKAVRSGDPPPLATFSGRRPGVSFIPVDARNILNTIIEVVSDLGGVDEAQILTATKQGTSGVNAINCTFHEILSAGKQHVSHYGFNDGDPVIYLVNDYSKDLTNGSLGRVITVKRGTLAVDFGHTVEPLNQHLSKDLALAYSITVHKSQGSQFPRVIMPVVQNRLLDRTLLYTAITRAVEQVILIGDHDTFSKAVSNPPYAHLRHTGFASALSEA